MLIHIKRNAEVFGPYSIEEAREYLSAGRLSLSDFAQLPSTTEWIPLASVPGVKSAPPPPPPDSPNEAAEVQRPDAATAFRNDFFDKYPDLLPYEPVVDAVAAKLKASGYKGESREAVMETFAKVARQEIARKQQPPPKSVPSPPTTPETQCMQPACPPTDSPQQKEWSNDIMTGPVIRDFFIVLGLQAGGIGIVSFFAGFAGESSPVGTIGSISLFLGIVGFAISGSLATGNRWEHLVKVACLTIIVYMILSFSFLHDSSFSRMLMNVAVAFLMMGLGGALSYLFKRR